MKRFEKANRIIHIITCFLNLGTIFYALMVCSTRTPLYGFFRRLSLSFGMPLLFMRALYLQYIIFGLIAVFTVIVYTKNKERVKRNVLVDVLLWTTTILELIFLERAFEAIVFF